MKKDHEDNLEFFLSNMGQLYLTGCVPAQPWEAPHWPGHRPALRLSPGSGPLGAGATSAPLPCPPLPRLSRIQGRQVDHGCDRAVTAPRFHPPASTSTPTDYSHLWSSRLPGAPPSSPPTSSGTTARPGMCLLLRTSPMAPAVLLPLSIRSVSPCDAGGPGGGVASPLRSGGTKAPAPQTSTPSPLTATWWITASTVASSSRPPATCAWSGRHWPEPWTRTWSTRL